MLIIIIFTLGYLAIAFEHNIKLNKAASALITGVLCWTIYVFSGIEHHVASEKLLEHMGEISGILFFLIGAMTIVELIDAHDGFDIISSRITTTNKKKLLWIISILAFLLSAVLDNLTTTIVLISLISKLMKEEKEKLYFAAMIVIAANAGGAWSPIGDVTTTMLWIGGQITSVTTIKSIFIPSLLSIIIPLFGIGFQLKGFFPVKEKNNELNTENYQKKWVFYFGMSSLLFVPLFKTLTGLPPFMGMLFSLGMMWILSEIINHRKDRIDKDILSLKNRG